MTLFDLSLETALINISVFINTHTQTLTHKQKPASVSYCPAVHDLLLPACSTWLPLQVLGFRDFFCSSISSDALITLPSKFMLEEVQHHQNREKAKEGMKERVRQQKQRDFEVGCQ